MDPTTIRINFPRELIVIKQGNTELMIDLRNIKLDIIGRPLIEQIQSQPLAVAFLLTALVQHQPTQPRWKEGNSGYSNPPGEK